MAKYKDLADSFTCADCGIVKMVHTSGGTGYGYDQDNRTICYACCGRRDAANMRATGKATLYLSKQADGTYKVTNWPGTLRLCVRGLRIGRHNIAGRRYDVWFPFEGEHWHGVTYGDRTQLCHCRRIKG